MFNSILNYDVAHTFPKELVKTLQDAFVLDTRSPNFPHYNVVRYLDGSFKIELAIAGYAPTELDIQFDESDNTLIIKGEKNTGYADDAYLHRGIALRDFTKIFTIAENLEVTKSFQYDGLLSIVLTPKKDAKKNTRKIDIEPVFSVNKESGSKKV